MYKVGGAVLILLGGIGLLTNQTPPGTGKTIDTAVYWALIAVGGVFVIAGLTRRRRR